MQIDDIETLLIGSILKHQNPNIWKGEYVQRCVDILFNHLSHSSKSSILTESELVTQLRQCGINQFVVNRCWGESGSEIVRYQITTKHLFYQIFFEENRTILWAELSDFMTNRLEYDMHKISAQVLVNGLMRANDRVDELCQKWTKMLRNSAKKARLIELTKVATESYLEQKIRNTQLKYNVSATAACIVAELVAEGQVVLSVSLQAGCNPKDKIDALLTEMAKSLA